MAKNLFRSRPTFKFLTLINYPLLFNEISSPYSIWPRHNLGGLTNMNICLKNLFSIACIKKINIWHEVRRKYESNYPFGYTYYSIKRHSDASTKEDNWFRISHTLVEIFVNRNITSSLIKIQCRFVMLARASNKLFVVWIYIR